MRAICGLTGPDAGTVRWNGAPAGQAEPRRREHRDYRKAILRTGHRARLRELLPGTARW